MPTLPNQLDLVVDIEGGRLIKSFDGPKGANPPSFTFGDSVPVTVRAVRPNATADSLPWSDVNLPNHSIRLGIGTPGGDPTSGTFQLTFDSNTTSNLSYNASAAAVQSALNALTTVQSAGNVAVTAAGGGGYRVAFNNVGARNLLTADPTPLYPASTAFINEAATGNATVREVQLIRIETSPATWVDLTDTLDAAAITIATTQTGNISASTPELQTVDLSSPKPYDGTYTLTVPTNSATTSAIDHNAAASAVQTALRAADSNSNGSVTVTGEFPLYTVQWPSAAGNVGALTASTAGLLVPVGRKGDLNLNTAGVQELLDGTASKQATLEVEIRNTTASTSWTPLQTPCLVKEDLVANSPPSTTPLPTYLAASDYGSLRSNTTVLTSTGGAGAKVDAFGWTGPASGITASTGNDSLNIATTGVHDVRWDIPYSYSGSGLLTCALRKNGSATPLSTSKTGTGSLHPDTFSGGGLISLTSGDVLTLLVTDTTNANVSISPNGTFQATKTPQ